MPIETVKYIRRAAIVYSILFTALIVNGFAANEELVQTIHDKTNCGACHVSGGNVNDGSHLKPTFNECTTCHTTAINATSTISKVFHYNSKRNCTDCHSYHDPQSISAKESVFTLALSESKARNECKTCHSSPGSAINLSNGHAVAAKLYHTDNPAIRALKSSEKCLACHSKNTDISYLFDSPLNIPAFNEHASHPLDVSFNRANSNRSALAGELVECVSCHDFQSEKKDLVLDSHGEGSVCFDCHQDKIR